MNRTRVLGHRPSTVFVVLLGIMFALGIGACGAVALVAWSIGQSFDWWWASFTSSALALSLCLVTWFWLHKRFFNVVPSASFAHGFDDGPWLSYKGDPRNSVVVNWYTMADAPSRVQYGSPGGREGVASGPRGRIHHVNIEGLEPGTTYSYTVLDFPKDGLPHEFKTAPAATSQFTFAVIGDTQNGGGRSPDRWAYPPLLQAMASVDPALVMHAGDATDQGNDLVSWHEFFDARPRLIACKPMHIASGNHDTGTHALQDKAQRKWADDGANYDYFFGYPYGKPRDEDDITSMRGRFYSFTYSNCLFVFVDTQTERLANPRNPQWQWLRRVLGSAPAHAWKVVVMHRDAVSVKKLADGSGYKMDYDKFSPYLLPIFIEHGVDVVFQGHDHRYLHLAYEHGVNPPPPGPAPAVPAGRVIHFFTSGSGGNFLRRNEPVLPASCAVHGFTRAENSSHFLHVVVDADYMTIEARYPDGTIMERVGIARTVAR